MTKGTLNFFELIRNKAFWLHDKLNNSYVANNITDIQKILSSNSIEFEELLRNRKQKIVTHAIKSTRFYNENPFDTLFEDLPIVDKNLIKKNFDSFVSNEMERSEMTTMVTSGSTGTPFTTLQCLRKRKRNTADSLYFANLAGYDIGNRLFYLKIWSDLNYKSIFTQVKENIVPIDVLDLKVKVNDFLNELSRRHSPQSMIGYASAFETVCKVMDQKNIQYSGPEINSIITISESLDSYTKEALNRLFHCNPYSRYSNIENGIIAQQTPETDPYFEINWASYYVEIIDVDSDNVLEDGRLGRIVVTDYYNSAMPMIRYDTGDLGVIEKVDFFGKVKRVLTTIEGRKLDQIFNTKGELISSYIVYKNMWKYTEIDQYQFIQEAIKKYRFKISISGYFSMEKELESEFKVYLGKDAEIEFEYVNEIPLLNSGKRKKIVNLMQG